MIPKGVVMRRIVSSGLRLAVALATTAGLIQMSSTATPKDGGLAGTATTSFLFTDFGMTKPRVMMVLSVEDTIKLEYRFSFVSRR
jgi:hypothetical protein